MREPEQDVFQGVNPLLPLEVRGVSLTLDAAPVLTGLDLTLEGRGITVIMGPNGAGKSQLLRLLNGLAEPSAGHITWGGVSSSQALRRRQSLVFQTPVLLRRSVAANVDFVLRRGARGRRNALLERVGLAAKARQPARALSGGEAQRLALARALATEPAVLLLDEPTASLDPSSTAMIEEIVLETSRDGTKVIFVTHDIAQARRLADEVVFLHRGRVAAHAPADRFFGAPEGDEARAYLEGRLLV